MMAPDTAMALQFLKALGGEQNFTFQTFAERKAKSTGETQSLKNLARTPYGLFNDVVEELVSLNVGDEPVGVFVTVNQTNGLGRKTADIVQVRAVFVDLDGAPIEPVISGPLPPTIVVETSPAKFHAYWCVSDVPLEEFSRIQKTLIKCFDGDPVVYDLQG